MIDIEKYRKSDENKAGYKNWILKNKHLKQEM